MDTFVECILKRFVCSCEEVFGHGSVYQHFENDLSTKQDGGLNSYVIFGRIHYTRDNDHHISPALLLKLLPTCGNVLESLPIQFVNEIFFYSRVMPFLQTVVVESSNSRSHFLTKFYDSDLRKNARTTEAVIILENLRHNAFRNSPRKCFLDYAHLSLMVRSLGKFHAYSYLAKESDEERFNAHAFALNNTHFICMGKLRGFLAKVGQRGLVGLRQQNDKLTNCGGTRRIRSLLEDADRLMVKMFKGERDNPLGVICHGDYLSGNVMFKYDDERHPIDMKMIDVAMATYGSPVLDLALVLYVNADQNTRDRYWDKLMDDYFDGLNSLASTTESSTLLPTRKDIEDEFYTRAFYAYLIASYFLPVLLAADLRSESIRQLVPDKYVDHPLDEIPQNILVDAYNRIGGEEGTKALANILKDMLKRGFI